MSITPTRYIKIDLNDHTELIHTVNCYVLNTDEMNTTDITTTNLTTTNLTTTNLTCTTATITDAIVDDVDAIEADIEYLGVSEQVKIYGSGIASTQDLTCGLHIKSNGDACIYCESDVDDTGGSDNAVVVGSHSGGDSLMKLQLTSAQALELVHGNTVPSSGRINLVLGDIIANPGFPPNLNNKVNVVTLQPTLVTVNQDIDMTGKDVIDIGNINMDTVGTAHTDTYFEATCDILIDPLTGKAVDGVGSYVTVNAGDPAYVGTLAAGVFTPADVNGLYMVSVEGVAGNIIGTGNSMYFSVSDTGGGYNPVATTVVGTGSPAGEDPLLMCNTYVNPALGVDKTYEFLGKRTTGTNTPSWACRIRWVRIK